MDPQPLNETMEAKPFSEGPDPVDPATVRTLFSTAASSNRWLKWIELLLSDVPANQFITNLDELMALCSQAEEAFNKEANVLTLDVAEEEDIVLVGDIHGQFKDLALHVLTHQASAKQQGRPDYKYLFLGDFVDRGPASVEVLILLLALKVEYPDLIHMLRGNHEEFQTCRIYGFSHECSTKFKEPKVFHRFNVVFTTLPLAAVVQTKAGRLFCAHGGLSPRLDLVESIQFVNRVEYEGGCDPDNGDIVDGLLWSDPTDACEFFSQNTRGCGYLFGNSATRDFLSNNSLAFVVRAHQLAMDGYSWEHNKQVLTIFSAPNYCGINNNKGAILLLHGASATFDDLDIRSYDVPDSADTPLFSPSSPIAAPMPDADALHGSYFQSDSKTSSGNDSPDHKNGPSDPSGTKEDRELLL